MTYHNCGLAVDRVALILGLRDLFNGRLEGFVPASVSQLLEALIDYVSRHDHVDAEPTETLSLFFGRTNSVEKIFEVSA